MVTFLYLSLPGHFDCYRYCYNYWLSFYRLPNLATLDMSRNKIVEIEQGAFEGAYSIDEMWVFVFVFLLGFEFEGAYRIDEMWVTDDMMVFVMMMMLMVMKVSKEQIKWHG